MRIIYLGDIVSRSGREAVIGAVRPLKEKYAFDALVVNADNAAHGFGCTPKICNTLFQAGVTAIVTGDHVWNQKELFSFLDDCKRIVRPLNYSETLPGVGAREIPLDNGKKLLLAEVVGRVFMEAVNCPLLALDKLLSRYILGKNIDAIFVDIHAEATAEKPRPKISFEVGETVRLKEGAFADFNGRIEEVDYDRSRLRVTVEIFGRETPVDISFSGVEKI